ncbi:MAG TPA: outer membrane protein transport protein [Kofleriaceae bacterium]|jgi:long-chain fatty acid transport protein|nr:outer membrane protein transport protein [Kofleriaceae bacterium]
MRTIVNLSVGFLVLSFSGVASANAFVFFEHDAKAVGRGNATTATDTDPSSISFNIGGLAAAEGTNVMIGGTMISPSGSFTDDQSGTKTSPEPLHAVLPHLYLTSRINDTVAVGIGFHAPFGLEITWPDPTPGVPNSSPSLDIVKFQSLRTYFITPSVGANLNKFVPGLTVGAGLDLVPATVEIRQYVYFGDTQGEGHLGGSAFGIGGRIGAMFKPAALPQLSVGAMWRSQINEDITGKADFDIADPYRSQLPPDGDISTSLTIPQSVALGAAYRPTPQIEIEANAIYMNWSKFKEIRIHLPDMTDAVAPQDYKDTVSYRLGAEYKLPAYNTAVRIGYIYDPSPIPATTLTAQLPDVDRQIISGGASYTLGNYAAHFGLLWVTPGSRKTSDEPYMPIHKGKFEIQALVASLTLAGHFGK